MDTYNTPQTLYTPFLKAKAGEADALARVPSEIRRRFTPFFDISRPSSFGTRTLDQQIDNAIGHISRGMGTEKCLYIDTYDIPLEARCENGDHPVQRCHNELVRHGLEVVY